MRRAVVVCLVLLTGCDRVFGLDERLPLDAPPPPPPEWIELAAGRAHTCAVGVDRTLWCWGENARWQSGLPEGAEELAVPTKVGDARWTTVATAYDHTCAIDEAKALWCWGSNYQNAIGAALLDDHLAPMKVLEDVTAVATGNSHTCAIRGDQTMWCWGRNMEGELALPPNNNEPVPRQIMSDLRWTKVAAGLFHTCGITTDGAFMCWGENTNQQGVVGGLARYDVPQSIEPGTQWIDVAVGYQHTCAVRATGTIRCQGFNSRGQLGAVTQGGVLVDAVQTGEPGRTWTRVFATVDQTCALRDDGSLWCWGSNAQNAIALGTIGQSYAPTRVADDGQRWLTAALGTAHLCAIHATGGMSCVGTDGNGQLGSTRGGSKLVPTRVDGVWNTVAVGGSSVCARDLSGAVWCWGANGFGQIGDATIDPKQKPVFVVAGVINGALVVGIDHACARTEANPNPQISCWGSNSLGELGTGVANYREESPQLVMGLTYPAQLAAGTHTCALTPGEILNCWGSNRRGQLGSIADTNPHPSPVYVPATWGVIAAGTAHTCGVRTLPAGSVECWGDNRHGQRGTAAEPDPAPVNVFAKTVSLGGDHSCAITTADQLQCWGENTDGQVGDDSLVDRMTPRPIGNAFWEVIALGLRHTCGLQFDGSLWCWGDNSRGQLGNGTRIDARTPTRIGTDTDWRLIVAGGEETCAIKDDDSLWCWGANSRGQIGDGTAWTFEPVRIAP